jgi:hypothetical protein
MRVTFKLVDLMKKIVLPNVSGPHLINGESE